MRFGRWIGLTVLLILMVVLLASSTLPPGNQAERVRAFTRDIEFDYVEWTLNALGLKISQIALNTAGYLPTESRKELTQDYIELVSQIRQAEARLHTIYTDPEVKNPDIESAELREDLEKLYARRELLGPLAESILQSQLADIIVDMGLSIGDQTIPPVLYHSTPLPLALIVSPRDTIRQDNNISLIPELTLDQQSALEEQVDESLDVSSLVVEIGGIGLYPTMVLQSNNLNWLSEVVAHEWTHNYLTLRPLGINYLTSPELRTMNETAASIAGKEIGREYISRYYPELLPPPETGAPSPPPPGEGPEFDFRAEMRKTRETVDQLLAEGKIEEAEDYMEERRIFFWENGYRLRKLNQAYFAFYGAYADQPGGAAGEDPVGAGVRALRAQSPTLADFLWRISWMTSFEELQEALEGADSLENQASLSSGLPLLNNSQNFITFGEKK
jgi:hypothetical protein